MARKQQIKARVINLVDFLSYQKDSIVSRELVNKKAGTVTLFAFDQGQGLSVYLQTLLDTFAYSKFAV